MGFITRFKSKISIKILFAFLTLSLISLILFGYISFSGMRGLSQYAQESSISMGEQVVGDSIKALTSQAEEHLLRSAKNQAAHSSALLEKVKTEVNIVVEFASNLWQEPLAQEYRKSYSQQEEPENIYSFSVYTLASGINIDTVREELNLSSEMDEIFISVFANDPNLNTICMGMESGIFRSYPWRSGRDPSYDPRKRYWYKKAKEKGKMIWTDPYIHAATKDLVITCAKPFYTTKGELIGVVEADVTLKVMQGEIIGTQIGKLGYAFLLDNHGNVIARPGLTPNDTRWDETYNTENLLQSDNKELVEIIKDMIAGNTGIVKSRFRGGEKYIAYAPVTGTNWSLGIAMPVSEIIAPALATKNKIVSAMENTARHINERIKNVKNIILSVFICIIFFVFLTAFRLSRKITQPVLALNEGAKIIGSGNLDYKLKIKTGDEIEDLAGAFNKMTRDLKVHINNLTATTAAKERMERELKIAHDIQLSIVPKIFPPFPNRREFDIYAVLQSAREVGGDFYDFFFIDDSHLCFLVGDVSGKGVPASLLMAVTITLIKAIARELKNPDEILDALNKEISRENDSAMFITIFCGILDIKTGEVSYACGGHNPPLIMRKGKTPEFLKSSTGTVVGILNDAVFEKEKLVLQSGDTIYMYTDGVTEAFNAERELFSEERLKEELSLHHRDSINELVGKTLQKIKSFAQGAPQSDDITVMALRYFHNNEV